MRKLEKILLFCAFFFVLHAITGKTHAQFGTSEPFAGSGPTGTLDDDDPPTGPCYPICDPDTGECPPLPPECIPIDGGLAFLLAAGVGYGVLRNRSSQKKEQKNHQETTAN